MCTKHAKWEPQSRARENQVHSLQTQLCTHRSCFLKSKLLNLFSHPRLRALLDFLGYPNELHFTAVTFVFTFLVLSIFTETPPQGHWVKSIPKWVTGDVKDGSGLEKEKQRRAVLCWQRKWRSSDTRMQGTSRRANALPAHLTLRVVSAHLLEQYRRRKSNWSAL